MSATTRIKKDLTTSITRSSIPLKQEHDAEGHWFIKPSKIDEEQDSESHVSGRSPSWIETQRSHVKATTPMSSPSTSAERATIEQNRLMELYEIIKSEGDETRAVLDFLKHVFAEASLAETFDTPRLACLLSPWLFENPLGLSPAEQDPQSWTRRAQLDSARNKDWLRKEMRLFLVCARTYRLVPCGLEGQGYLVMEARNWVKRHVGVVRVMVEITSVASGVGAAVRLISNLVEAVGAASEIAKNEDILPLKERYTALVNEEKNRGSEQLRVIYHKDTVSMETRDFPLPLGSIDSLLWASVGGDRGNYKQNTWDYISFN